MLLVVYVIFFRSVKTFKIFVGFKNTCNIAWNSRLRKLERGNTQLGLSCADVV